MCSSKACEWAVTLPWTCSVHLSSLQGACLRSGFETHSSARHKKTKRPFQSQPSLSARLTSPKSCRVTFWAGLLRTVQYHDSAAPACFYWEWGAVRRVHYPLGNILGGNGYSLGFQRSEEYSPVWHGGGWRGGREGARRAGPLKRNSPMAFSCSAFVCSYLAVPCYSNHTMRYKAAGGCSPPHAFILLLPPSFYKPFKSFFFVAECSRSQARDHISLAGNVLTVEPLLRWLR